MRANLTASTHLINKIKLTDSQTLISPTRSNKILHKQAIFDDAAGHTKSGGLWPQHVGSQESFIQNQVIRHGLNAKRTAVQIPGYNRYRVNAYIYITQIRSRKL